MSDELEDTMGWDDLTERQREVALLAAEGMTNKEIADQLGISFQTVRNHMAGIAQRLGMQGQRGNRVRVSVTRWVMRVNRGTKSFEL